MINLIKEEKFSSYPNYFMPSLLYSFMVLEPCSASTWACSLLTSFNILLFFLPSWHIYLYRKSLFEDVLDIHGLKNRVYASQSQLKAKVSDDKENPTCDLWKKTNKIVLR